jgi:hypothetical protein
MMHNLPSAFETSPEKITTLKNVKPEEAKSSW